MAEGTYTGMMKMDMRHGNGIMTYNDGTTLPGNWIVDMPAQPGANPKVHTCAFYPSFEFGSFVFTVPVHETEPGRESTRPGLAEHLPFKLSKYEQM